MIANELHRKPMLSFGLGVLEKTISLGQTTTVYQNNIYNNEEYILRLDGINKPIYGFNITPVSTGVHEIQCVLQVKKVGAFLKSNIIKLTVV